MPHERKLRGLLPLDRRACSSSRSPRPSRFLAWARTWAKYANTIAPPSARPTTLPRVPAAAHHREVAVTYDGWLASCPLGPRGRSLRTPATDAWYDGGPAGGRPRAPLLPRWTSCRDLARVAFPHIKYTSALATSTSICGRVPSLLPIKDFVDAVRDPYLPWLHDLFVGEDGTRVDVLSQN